MSQPSAKGYAAVDGMELYWESFGSGGTPPIVVHGGFGLISMFGALIDELAERRRVLAVELQGHGHTRDIDRPFSYEAFGDDVAGGDRATRPGTGRPAGILARCWLQPEGRHPAPRPRAEGWPWSRCPAAVTAGFPRCWPCLIRWAAAASPR